MTMSAPGQVAPIARRVLAYVIDAAITVGIVAVVPTVVMMAVVGRTGVLVAVLIGMALYGLLGLGWFIVYTLMQGGRGSIGMRAQRIRLADAVTGAPVGFGRALLRNIIWGLAGSIVVGCFSPLFDGTGRFQGWHDKVGGAMVLDAGADGAGAPRSGEAPASGAAAPALVPPAAPSAPATAHLVDEAAEQTVLAPRAGRESAPDPLISFVPGVTQDAPVRSVDPEPEPDPPAPAPAPVPAPAPAPAPEPSSAPAPAEPTAFDDADDLDDDIESTRISIPGHRLIFTWDDGVRVPVSGRTVFGRSPEQESGATVVAVRDETLSLSKTHFEAGAATSGGWVLDRHSTNGTVVVRDGMRIACPPGQRVPIRLGDALEIGDRIVTIGGYA